VRSVEQERVRTDLRHSLRIGGGSGDGIGRSGEQHDRCGERGEEHALDNAAGATLRLSDVWRIF
jgi:hypothetical protein